MSHDWGKDVQNSETKRLGGYCQGSQDTKERSLCEKCPG